MSVRFELDTSGLEELQNKFKRLPGNVENIINSYLHNEAPEKPKEQIIKLMPVSEKNKKHAKTSNPLKVTNINLGFEIFPKRRFNYLVFPDKALGTSYGKDAQEFMQRGLNTNINDIMNGLNDRVDTYLKEEF